MNAASIPLVNDAGRPFQFPAMGFGYPASTPLATAEYRTYSLPRNR